MMKADGLLAVLDRWGRAALPGAVLLFFVLLTLAPLRAPYLSDALPLLPALVVFQFSLATPERLPGPLLLAMGILLDLLLGGPGAPVGVSALGFVLIRASVLANRRYLVGVPFLFQWFGFCLLALGFVILVWGFTALWTWTAIDADTKLNVSWLLGDRTTATATEFMVDLASRLSNRVQITSDGYKAYLEAVEGAFGIDVDYAQLVKIYGEAPEAQKRYSPAECVGCKRENVTGNPDPDHISTS